MNIRLALNCSCEDALLRIRAVTGLNIMSSSPFQPLPALNSVVSISGDVMGIRQGIMFLAVDDFSCLPPQCTFLPTLIVNA